MTLGSIATRAALFAFVYSSLQHVAVGRRIIWTSTPAPSCGSLLVQENSECARHVEWAFNEGRHHHQADVSYRDILAITRTERDLATIEDFHRLSFCGGFLDDSGMTVHDPCGLPPCSCSSPPCDVCDFTPPPPPHAPEPVLSCGSLLAGDNLQCAGHVTWAFQEGQIHPAADARYRDIVAITGRERSLATIEDFQRLSFCDGFLDDWGVTAPDPCVLPPCECSSPPCDLCKLHAAPNPLPAPAPDPVPFCGTLFLVENLQCARHVTWAFQKGQHHLQANARYRDMPAITSQPIHEATMEDFQRLSFCGGFLDDAGSIAQDPCALPPCSCSSPPCDVCHLLTTTIGPVPAPASQPAPNPVPAPASPPASAPAPSLRDPSCAANSGCAYLSGLCCPHEDGTMLACCDNTECSSLQAHENHECSEHVHWAHREGKNHPNAPIRYADMESITGSHYSVAALEDFQRLNFCGGFLNDDGVTSGTPCGAPPCSCSNPPCDVCDKQFEPAPTPPSEIYVEHPDELVYGWHPKAEEAGHPNWCSVNVAHPGWRPNSCPSITGDLEVRVLSYNLFWWNLFGIRGGMSGSAGRLISDTGNLDIMAFQECDDVHRIINDAGYANSFEVQPGTHAVANAWRRSVWERLASDSIEVAEDRWEQHYGRRTVTWARLRHRDTEKVVFFMNHHGPLPVNTGGLCGGEATAYGLLRIIGIHAFKGDAVILTGDFNADHRSETVATLSRFLHLDYTGSSFGGVDNFLSNDCAEAVDRANLGNGGSDHDALAVTYRLR